MNELSKPAIQKIPDDLRVGGKAGDTGYFGRPGGLPLDQSTDDVHSLVYESSQLETSLQFLGKAKIQLEIKTPSLPAQIVLRLCDVSPQGEVARVCFRVHNLKLETNYKTVTKQKKSGGINKVIEIELPNAAYEFMAEHRIRLAVSTSYWPIIWPAPGTPDIAIQSDKTRLWLPVIKAVNEVTAQPGFEDSLTPVNRNPESVAERIQRETMIDDENGLLIYRWRQPLSMVHHNSVNLEIGAETSAEHFINMHDAQSARSCFTHRLVLIRQQDKIEATGIASVKSSGKNLVVEGSLKVKENSVEIYSRHWSKLIKREYS